MFNWFIYRPLKKKLDEANHRDCYNVQRFLFDFQLDLEHQIINLIEKFETISNKYLHNKMHLIITNQVYRGETP